MSPTETTPKIVCVSYICTIIIYFSQSTQLGVGTIAAIAIGSFIIAGMFIHKP